ncbi:MAG: TIGR01777 family oxidoreductase [Acidobacteriota bacterium]
MSAEEKRIAVSGASGLLGRRLLPALRQAGWSPQAMVRRPGGDGIFWDPRGGTLDAASMEGLDAVVHLAGENVFGRWTDAKKERIDQSRVLGTRLISQTLAGLERPPRVLVSASAIGYYGDRGDAIMDESGTLGEGFLAEVCGRWEAETAAARDAGVRVVNLRIGIVLAKGGGALKQMLPPFKMGVGGRLGDGQQWFSWIHIDDVVRSILFALDRDDLEGPVNCVAPAPVRNQELTRVLGRVVRRPTLFPVPKFALGVVFGEMAEETLLASTRVAPAALEGAGFRFEHPDLEAALRREV